MRDNSRRINKVSAQDIIPQIDDIDFKIPKPEERPELLQKKHLLGYFGADAIVRALYEENIA